MQQFVWIHDHGVARAQVAIAASLRCTLRHFAHRDGLEGALDAGKHIAALGRTRSTKGNFFATTAGGNEPNAGLH